MQTATAAPKRAAKPVPVRTTGEAATELLAKYGDAASIARRLELGTSTVRAWRRYGLPYEWVGALREYAKELRIRIPPHQLFADAITPQPKPLPDRQG